MTYLVKIKKMRKTKMSDIAEFVKERNEAIIYAWENKDFSKIDKFTKKYVSKKVYNDWIKASTNVKVMTLCSMTLNITSEEIKPYYDRARKTYKEVIGHDYEGMKND